MKKKIYKVVAVFLAINILFEIVSPTIALALTTGPSQPEMQSFEPIGTTEMVDPFSGDFNYNIPLMTVPGPNGGYPVNLAYHAGIGMEEEASWVGLGWNINAGEINRQMRGLPDDFDGDVVEKVMYMKPDVTASIKTKVSIELVDLDAEIGIHASLSTGLTYSSYHGIGFTFGTGFTASQRDNNGFGGGVNMSYNSLSGDMEVSPSLSYAEKTGNTDKKYGLSFSYGSVEGAKNLSFGYNKTEEARVKHTEDEKANEEDDSKGSSTSHSAGVSFSNSSYVPYSEMPRSGFSISTGFDLGLNVWMVNPYLGGEAFYSQNKIKENTLEMQSYGYMYSQNRATNGGDQSLMDFNREKDAQLTKDIPAMPQPVFTNDIYFVQGQGVGGSFRPYRSDIGILHDPVITSKTYGADLSGEVGVGTGVKVAADITVSYSKAYSGGWQDAHTWSDLKGTGNYEFKDNDLSKPLYESFYFRSAGDMTANYDETQTTPQGTADALPISFISGFNPSSIHTLTAEVEQPLVDFQVKKGALGASKLGARPSRSQVMSYRVNAELHSPNPTSEWSDNTIYSLNHYPRNTVSGYPKSPDYASFPEHHIGEITVVNPDGNRYIYGIPAYNTVNREVSFSVEGNISGANNTISADEKLVDYKASDDIGSVNSKGNDHFFAYKSLPRYAHSYLLTAIVSPDYVDLTGDGLTEDDYGYYVKFNYTKMSGTYNWRSPFTKASFIKGYQSVNANDDKAGYTYGSKEIWYLNSIETKTHIAEFTLSDRKDGFGANNEHNGTTGATSDITGMAIEKLDKIDLYSKADPDYASGSPTPIKTVHFDYTYDLCGSVQNNDNSTTGTNYYTGTDRNANHGKLTLKKVWFSYLNNNKGSVSPYEFDYHERKTYGGTINTDENPNFSTMQVDRWGNYKSGAYDPQDPYTDQHNETAAQDTIRNNNASAWCLKEISLPSGGKIKVDYESDDYAYVQNVQAMQMAKILGTGHTDASHNVIKNNDNEITGDNLLLFFELESQHDVDATGNPVALSNATVWKYIKNIDDMYFKTYQRLKHEYLGGAYAYDYVSGYAKIDATEPDAGSSYGLFEDPHTPGAYWGFVKVKSVNVHDNNNASGDKTHPFRKAGWQYLKLSRPDLLYPASSTSLGASPSASALLSLVSGIVGYFTSNVQLFAGFYNYCAINGYCKQLDMGKSSFIRLNSFDKIKYGGGHRVKSIRITDTWTHTGAGDTESEYGQQYIYKLKDGSSSGVAEYEPLIGGEEIALRKPIRYSSDYFILKHDNLYMEYPFCESYYPAAGVGYSRVIVKSINQTDNTAADVTKGVQGIMMYEYYTAKDFPVIVNSSALTHKKFTPDISIPFIGNVSFENHGCAQTFTVETNDMHGRMKSTSSYTYGTDLLAAVDPAPVTKTEYIYKTDAAYSPSGVNHLNNEVDVLYDDAYYKKSNVGMTKEFFMDMRERSNVSMTNGGQVNAEINYPPPAAMFMFVSKVSYAESVDKMVVGMNVISRNGVLMETRQYNEGAMASTKNLMFDASTGKPLLTQLTNDFNAPVYNYNYAAAWNYERGIGAAYQNIDEVITVNTAGSGIFNIASPSPAADNHKAYFTPGDEIMGLSPSSEVFYVTNVTATSITIKDKNNALYSGSSGTFTIKIIRAGRRNHLSESSGNIVSLNNPVTGRNFPLFKAWNDYIDAHPGGGFPSSLTFVDCASGRTLTTGVSISGNQVVFTLSLGTDDETALCEGCKCTVINVTFATTPYTAQFHLSKMGQYVLATELNGSLVPTGNTQTGKWIDQNSCLKDCMDGVLHASAVELTDAWTYDYTDVNNNQMNGNGVPSFDGYAAGKMGIWRPLRSSVYQADRKQGVPTDISKDGTYKNFALFDWQNSNNPEWTWTSEVTKYNPYGYEIENRDPLNIYSAALYGYNNSVPTAIASNSSYYETAFDGFEDYKNNDYSTATTGHKHGHINLAVAGDGGTLALNSDSHSGKYSLQISSGASANFVTSSAQHFTPVAGKKYQVSAWFKGDNATSVPAITIPSGGTVVSTTISDAIEGWRKCDVVFTTTGTTATINFDITSSTLKLVDDIRIIPFQSGLKTYVYNPQTLWLVAELDNQNFATFYNYDQEGTLVQVKKETASGVRTIKTTRSNIKRKNS